MIDTAGTASHRRCRIRRNGEKFYSQQVSEGDVFNATAAGIPARSDSKVARIEEAAGFLTRAYRRICLPTAVSLNARKGPRISEGFGHRRSVTSRSRHRTCTMAAWQRLKMCSITTRLA